MTMRKKLNSVLYEPNSKYFIVVNDLLAIITLSAIFGLVLSTVPSLSQYQLWFTTIEWISITIFTLEYMARIYAHGKNWRKYIVSFYGIVDLMAIAPTYLGLSNLTFLKSARIFRILQLLRALRILKISHLARLGLDEAPKDTRLYRLTVYLYFFSLFTSILIFGTLMYVFEGTNPTFSSIPLAMLWATKPLLGGVAQTEPVTIAGNIIVVFIRFSGLVLLGLLINVIGSSVHRLLIGKH